MVAHLFSALRAFGCVGEKIVHFQMEEIRLLVHYQTFSAYKDFSAPRSLGGDAEKIGHFGESEIRSHCQFFQHLRKYSNII